MMGDKRYYYNIFDDGTEYIEDYWGNEHYFNLDDVEELLNEQQAIITELNKQIEQLNLAIDDLLSHTSCDEIKKENEQLRKELNDCEKFRYAVFKRMEEIW